MVLKKNNKATSLYVAICFVLTIAVNLFTVIFSRPAYAAFDGVHIYTASDFNAMLDIQRDPLKYADNEAKTFYLMNDILFTASESCSSASYFYGTLCGNNHALIFDDSNSLDWSNQYIIKYLRGTWCHVKFKANSELELYHSYIYSCDYWEGAERVLTGRIEYCINYADLYEATGGLCDHAWGGINYCGNEGNLRLHFARTAGGVVGSVGSSRRPTLTQCYNTGAIAVTDPSADGTYCYIGGIAGYANDAQIESCYNIGTINIQHGAVKGCSGIVGQLDGYYASVSRCYNAGVVRDTDPIVGAKTNKSIQSTAYEGMNYDDISVHSPSSANYQLTTAQMTGLAAQTNMTYLVPSAWDFRENTSTVSYYPKFKWQTGWPTTSGILYQMPQQITVASSFTKTYNQPNFNLNASVSAA